LTVKKKGGGDKGMGLTMTTNGRAGKERDDDQMKWEVGDGTSTTTRINHQMVKRQ
jgi:hypothetical protein